MLDKIIYSLFYLLFFLTPLIWTPLNYELFEYNKMMLVYFLTILITSAWLLKSINQRKLNFHHTPLDIPLLLFLASQVLSTIFSIDQHTSVWGYYSRANGGLLSLISYLLLYWAFVSNLNKDQALKALKMGLWGGLVVALWAIPEHFGLSPSCVILRHQLNASCWVQDVQARVFATLGQPNWLASYLAMLIFPCLYFILTSSNKSQTIRYTLYAIIYYLAFTFTYSRGATFGILAGLAVFVGVMILRYKDIRRNFPLIQYRNIQISIFAIFLLINLIFGSGLSRFQLTQYLNSSQQSTVNSQQKTPTITALESGGTDAGKIRLIVWQGALDIFKHFPIFGSGVETFAYSYYQFRPSAHNLTSEWDFLYNKAHNEYLNYLANSGIVGFFSYMAVVGTFIFWSIKWILGYKDIKRKGELFQYHNILVSSLLASYTSYLVHNFFLFSVVITSLFFFLFPAVAFIMTDSTKPLKFSRLITYHLSLITFIYYRPAYTKAIKIFLLLVTCYLLLTIIRFWYTDTLFSIGEKNAELGNAGKAYNYLSTASSINKSEPFYKSELGFAGAAAASALQSSDATLSAHLKDEALANTEQVLRENPKNVSFYRTAIRTYYQLSTISDEFISKTLQVTDQTIKLAPTDPKLYYNKAIILGQVIEAEKSNQHLEEAIANLERAIQLKPNYREAYVALSLFYFDKATGEKDRQPDQFKLDQQKAVNLMRQVLVLAPNDSEALGHLNEWGSQGIATKSGNSN